MHKDVKGQTPAPITSPVVTIELVTVSAAQPGSRGAEEGTGNGDEGREDRRMVLHEARERLVEEAIEALSE